MKRSRQREKAELPGKGPDMVIKTVELETVVGVTTKTIPESRQPEIAFAGRSNVGKSSLINALMNRKNYARVSETPGKTRTMNFYHINNEFFFVDLPGYGYAKVKQDFKSEWGPLIEGYFAGSKDLIAIFLLLDIRREPNQDDLMMFDWMTAAGFDPIVIATKSDKVKRQEKARRIASLKKLLKERSGRDVNLIPFSSADKSGREEIYDLIDSLLERSGQ